jgi:hypothetical protein
MTFIIEAFPTTPRVIFRWGPDVNDVEETLVAACTAIWYLIALMAERVEPGYWPNLALSGRFS